MIAGIVWCLVGRHIGIVALRDGGGWSPRARPFRGLPDWLVSVVIKGPFGEDYSCVLLTERSECYNAGNQMSGN